MKKINIVESVKVAHNEDIADYVLRVGGPVGCFSSSTKSTTYYDCELDIASKKGIDLNDYTIISWMPGLHSRGEEGVTNPYIDGYELHLKKK